MSTAARSPSRRTGCRTAAVLAAALALPLAAAEPGPAPPAAEVVDATGAADTARVVAFDDLPGHVGAAIVVHTTYGTVRRGVLTGASSISINMKLDAADGGIALSLPRESVAKVELVAPNPAD